MIRFKRFSGGTSFRWILRLGPRNGRHLTVSFHRAPQPSPWDDSLDRLPRDVQRLMKAAGVTKVSKYAGRIKHRPTRK